MHYRFAIIALTALSAVLFIAPTAGAATTVGSNLSGTADDAFGCNSTCSIVSTAFASGPGASPVDGVVVRWRIKTNGAGGPFGLRIAKPFTGDLRIGAGASALEAATVPGVNQFTTRLPIRVGDNIGLTITAATEASNVRYKPGIVSPGANVLYFDPQLPEGGSGTAPTLVNADAEVFFNADIEADADRDGFGDETQDRCVGVFGTADGCDVTPPAAVLTTYGPQSVGSLKVKLSTNETTTFEARATVKYKSKGKSRTIRGKLAKLSLTGANLPKSVSLKFSSKQLKQLRALLKKGKKLSAKVDVVATDASGNKATLGAKVKLKR